MNIPQDTFCAFDGCAEPTMPGRTKCGEHLYKTEATFRVTREVFEKFCEAADVQGYIGRIDFCAGLTAIGIKNEYVDDEPECREDCKGECCLG